MRKGCENQLFESFSGWDICSEMSFQFYDARLRVEIGDYMAGDTVDCAMIDHEQSRIVLTKNDGNNVTSEKQYELSYTIGEEIID